MTIIEGNLLKDGGWRRGWRKRYFKLSKIYFQYFENDFATEPKGAAVRGTIQNVEIVDLATFHFKVTFKSETWDLKADSREELVKWMETLQPRSAESIRRTHVSGPTDQTAARNLSVTALDPEPSEHAYQPLPQAAGFNPRFSVGSDGRTSPSTSASRVRTISSSSARSQSPVPSSPLARANTSPRPTNGERSEHSNLYVRQSLPASFSVPPISNELRRKSCDPVMESVYEDPIETMGVLNVGRTTPNLNQPRTSMSSVSPSSNHPASAVTAPPEPPEVLPLDFSDDEFLDFGDDDVYYVNNPLQQVDTLRKEIRSLRLSDQGTLGDRTSTQEGGRGGVSGRGAPPTLNLVPHTPEGTLVPSAYSLATAVPGPGLLSHHQYENDPNRSIEEDASPVPLRRSIKSQSGAVDYSITMPDKHDSEDETELPLINIKSTEPMTTDHTLHRNTSTTSFLAAPSPTNKITTLRVQEWIKNVQQVKKAFVDPEDQEVGELDKFLIEHAACLPKENINLIEKIGNGAFGEVWKARCNPSINGDNLVAVKCLKDGASDKHRHDFYGEAALLGQFKHDNVIALHGVVLQQSSPWIVIEYAEKGALKSFLKKNGEDRHSNQLLNYCRDIVKGMNYLSERGYIHRDLAARNVLLTRMEVCKIADFGLSRKLGDDDDIYVSRGGMVAIKWTAPEGVLGASYSSASDVWSCGVTMWEVFSDGANPWSGCSNEDAFRAIRKGGRLTRPEKCPLDVFKVMLKCWQANPIDRPTFTELERLLYNPDTENIEQPLYENTDGFVQYMNLSYENMQDVERT